MDGGLPDPCLVFVKEVKTTDRINHKYYKDNMNKRQAKKIVDNILTGKHSQYTLQQQRKARQACLMPYVYSGNITEKWGMYYELKTRWKSQ